MRKYELQLRLSDYDGAITIGRYGDNEGMALFKELSKNSSDYGISPLCDGFETWKSLQDKSLDKVISNLREFGYCDIWKRPRFMANEFWGQLTDEEKLSTWNRYALEKKESHVYRMQEFDKIAPSKISALQLVKIGESIAGSHDTRFSRHDKYFLFSAFGLVSFSDWNNQHYIYSFNVEEWLSSKANTDDELIQIFEEFTGREPDLR